MHIPRREHDRSWPMHLGGITQMPIPRREHDRSWPMHLSGITHLTIAHPWRPGGSAPSDR
jgi:hypothetical protein